MTEIAMRDTAALDTYTPATVGAITRLADWADELHAAGQIAVKLCQTPFVPQHFRGKPADAAAAILTGHELGLSPLAALRSIFLINGTPGMYAKSMVAVAQAQGHQVWIAEQSPTRVVVRGRRRGEPEVYETTWDVARVEAAGLASNPMYKKNRQAMMVARGQAEITRQVAADALHGIPYAVEELEDFDDRPARAELTATERVTVAEIMGTDGPAEDPDPMITKAQQRKLHATLGDLGLGDREAGLAKINRLLDRPDNPVTSTKELTKVDAGIVIDNLDAQLLARQAPPEPDLDDWPQVTTPDEEA
jgi:hypothetical protein